MAHITKRTTAGGESRYDVRWKALGRSQTKTFKRRADADAFRRALEADELRGVVVDVRRSSSPFGDFATAWLATRRRADGRPLTPATRALYGDLLARLILPTFDRAKLASIQPAPRPCAGPGSGRLLARRLVQPSRSHRGSASGQGKRIRRRPCWRTVTVPASSSRRW